MNLKQRKRWSLAIWTWLADNPGKGKDSLPPELKTFEYKEKIDPHDPHSKYKKVSESLRYEKHSCPLCTIFFDYSTSCSGCPLSDPQHMLTCNTEFHKWEHAVTYSIANLAGVHAGHVRRMIAGWKV